VKESIMDKRLTRSQAIKAKCLDCSGDSAKERRECQITNCALWPWRIGKEQLIPGSNNVASDENDDEDEEE